MSGKGLSFSSAENRLWLKWVLANFAAAVIGDLPVLLMVLFLEADLGAISGTRLHWFWWFLALSALQWLVLRPWIRRFRGWLIATMVAVVLFLIVSGPISKLLFSAVPDVLAVTIIGGLLGALLGIAQWTVLRRRFSGAGWWVLASTAGWMAAELLDQVSEGSSVFHLFVPGLVTGIALISLLRKTPEEGEEGVPRPVL